jgi:thiol-disulfide isomerase/thioredoxin
MLLDQPTITQKETLNKVFLAFRILLSFMFLLSAVAKLYPSPHFALTTFEIKQLLPMGFSEFTAAHFSRTLIGCELALGIGLLQPHYFRRLVLPLSFLILFVFSAQLVYEIFISGNSGNCGCFGSLLPMTPLQALIKNIIAMGMIGWMYKITDKSKDKLNIFLVLSLVLASILSIYMIGPMRQITTKVSDVNTEIIEDDSDDVNNNETEDDDKIISTTGTTPLKSDTIGKKTAKEEVKPDPNEPKKKKSGYANYFPDIDKDKKILCFFAPGCDHCKETAKELTQLKKEIPNFPEIKIVFMDEEAELIPNFFEFAGSKYSYQIADVATFWQTMGTTKDTPGVIYLWNGNVIKEYDGINEKKFVKSEFKKIITKK